MKVNSVHEGELTFSFNDLVTVCHTYIPFNDLVTVCHTYIHKVSITW